MAKRKIKIKHSALKESKIKVSIAAKQEHINFSFKFFDNKHKKFSIQKENAKYFLTVICKLKDYSSWDVKRLMSSRSSSIRCHKIDWTDSRVTETEFSTVADPQLKETEAFQLTISANKHGRIHGFFIQNTFHVVWFDPGHDLYN